MTWEAGGGGFPLLRDESMRGHTLTGNNYSVGVEKAPGPILTWDSKVEVIGGKKGEWKDERGGSKSEKYGR